MAKNLECSECGTKFRVITESVEPIAYCPMCGDTAVSDFELVNEEDDDVDVGDDLHEYNPDDEE